MAFLTNVLVIGKILTMASTLIRKEWKPVGGKTAQKCPVCEGKGTTKYILGGPARDEDRNCHGCIGKGWVVV